MSEPTPSTTGLAGITAAAQQAPGHGLPPVHLWHPNHCGDIDIVIRRDGVWMHEGSPIGRTEMVRLFSTVLRLDPDGYHLVTPGEKLKITVEDMPFRAIDVQTTEDGLVFTTDVGDTVLAGPDHPIEVATHPDTAEPAPRVHVRADLWARIARPVFYELVEAATLEGGELVIGSGGARFVLGPVGAAAE